MPLLSRRQFIKLVGGVCILGPGPAVHSWAESSVRERNIGFWVNGQPVKIPVNQSACLLDFLRGELGLTGTKYGCGVGVCGACTVLINHRPVRSCVVDIRHLSGMRVVTVEGLGGPDSLDPIQKVFADLGVFQCGYCAPGFVLSTKALLSSDPHPDREKILTALSGNLCRCTGYQRIVQAITAVNNPDLLKSLKNLPYSRTMTGRPDMLAEAKVTGRILYAGDRGQPDRLFGRAVWSDMAHARITGLDISTAVALPGVVRVLTHKDVPGKNLFGSVAADQPVLAEDTVRFRGEAVALVLAETAAAAAKAADLVRVSYEHLPGLFDPSKALSPEAPQLTPKGNLCHRSVYGKGDIEEGRSRAAVVVRNTYRTRHVEHAYLEPETCLTYISDDGYLVVATASQAAHGFRDQIAAICDLPTDRVRMETTLAGGAFGGKGDLTVQHLCALGTVKTGKPVRMALTREESFRVSVKRHPFILNYETGADSTGRLTHCRVTGLADAGAYQSASMVVVDDAATFATGPYQVDHISVDIKGVFTNNPVCGAMRGFGVPQVCLAMERQMDELARRLEMDPIEFRLINALDEGRISQWGQVMGPGVGIKACLETLKSALREESKKATITADEKIGLGVAACYKNASTPTFLPFGRADVDFILTHQGRVVVRVGSSELGQGLVTVLVRIMAEMTGVLEDHIDIEFGSTQYTKSPVLTTSSQATFLTGGAVADGAPLFRDLIIRSAASLFMRDASALNLTGEGIVDRNQDLICDLGELAWRAELAGQRPHLHHTYTPPITNIEAPEKVETIGPGQAILPSLGYGAQAARVAVNVKSGEVRVLEILAAHDVGRAINPVAVEGQVHGGVVMGLGWCLKERLEVEEGRIINDNLDRYIIPRADDVPEIKTLIVEVPDPMNPLGAKGLGEVPLVPTAPAVLNAIRDAVGVDLVEIPVSAEAVRRALVKVEVET